MARELDVYTHSQDTASTTWTVAHNLGRLANVDVAIDYEGELVKAIPARIVASADLNSLTITWSSAQSGKVLVF